MKQKNILILAYSHLSSDPRVRRQIDALKGNNIIHSAGYSPYDDSKITFFQIYILPPFSLKRKIKRFLQYLLKKYDTFYWDDGKITLLHQLQLNNYDAIIANDIHTLPLALAIANNKSKIWFDAHEYHPKEFEDILTWRLFSRQYVTHLCKKYFPKTNVFTTVCEGIANEYQKKFGMLPQVITNAAAYHNLNPSLTDEKNIKLIHHGAAIEGRKIEELIKMMSFLGENFSLDLMLVGNNKYTDKLKKLAADNKKINFISPVPQSDICNVLNKYDIGVYILPPSNFNNLHALPNKFFESLQARLCLAISPNPEMAKLVRDLNLGVISTNFTAKAMAEVLNTLTKEKIMNHKKQSHLHAKMLSSEENIIKIREIVANILHE